MSHPAVELTTDDLADLVESLSITTTSLLTRANRATSTQKRREFLTKRARISTLHMRLQTILDQRLVA